MEKYKDGDIIRAYDVIVIIKKPYIDNEGRFNFKQYAAYSYKSNNLIDCDFYCNQKASRYATDEEKNTIKEAMQKSGNPYYDEVLKKFFADKTDHKNDRKDNKFPWELLPIEVIEEAVKVYQFGAEKYGKNTWQKLENGKERYYAALMRHLVAWRKGEKVDAESGLSPLAHVLWNVISLIWLEQNDGKIQNTEG